MGHHSLHNRDPTFGNSPRYSMLVVTIAIILVPKAVSLTECNLVFMGRGTTNTKPFLLKNEVGESVLLWLPRNGEVSGREWDCIFILFFIVEKCERWPPQDNAFHASVMQFLSYALAPFILSTPASSP